MRQQLVDTQILDHRKHIKLGDACDSLLRASKDTGGYGTLAATTNPFNDCFGQTLLNEITSRHLSRWIEYEHNRAIKDIRIRLWARQFNEICRNVKRLGYYTPEYEWGEWNIKDKPICYLTDEEEQKILSELDPAENSGWREAWRSLLRMCCCPQKCTSERRIRDHFDCFSQ